MPGAIPFECHSSELPFPTSKLPVDMFQCWPKHRPKALCLWSQLYKTWSCLDNPTEKCHRLPSPSPSHRRLCCLGTGQRRPVVKWIQRGDRGLCNLWDGDKGDQGGQVRSWAMQLVGLHQTPWVRGPDGKPNLSCGTSCRAGQGPAKHICAKVAVPPQ